VTPNLVDFERQMAMGLRLVVHLVYVTPPYDGQNCQLGARRLHSRGQPEQKETRLTTLQQQIRVLLFNMKHV
jgi:hypothetical protein